MLLLTPFHIMEFAFSSLNTNPAGTRASLQRGFVVNQDDMPAARS